MPRSIKSAAFLSVRANQSAALDVYAKSGKRIHVFFAAKTAAQKCRVFVCRSFAELPRFESVKTAALFKCEGKPCKTAAFLLEVPRRSAAFLFAGHLQKCRVCRSAAFLSVRVNQSAALNPNCRENCRATRLRCATCLSVALTRSLCATCLPALLPPPSLFLIPLCSNRNSPTPPAAIILDCFFCLSLFRLTLKK